MPARKSFAAFLHSAGITRRSRMTARSVAMIERLYDAWRDGAPATEWEPGELISIQRTREGRLELCHASGAVVSIELR
jgi:hypothetical protein